MGPNVEKLRKCRSIVEIHNIVKSISTSTATVNRTLVLLSKSSRSKPMKVSLSVKDETKTFKQGRKGQIVDNVPTLSDISGVKLKNYTAPNAATLSKHADMLHKLHGNEVDLNAAEGMLLHSFAGSAAQKKVLASIKELKKATRAGLDKAFSILNNIGINHMPVEMTTVVAEVSKFITENIGATSYTALHDDMDYVVPADTTEFKNDEFQFCHYTQLKNLKNDKGFVFEDFFFILTGIVNKAGVMRFYLSAFPNFIAPGHYPIGKSVANVSEIDKRLHFLMLRNDIATAFEARPLGLSEKDLKAKGFTGIPGVATTIVNKDTLTVKLVKGLTADQIKNVVTTVMPLLSFHAGGRSSLVTNKPRFASGFTYIDFKLVPKVAHKGDQQKAIIDEAKLNELQDALGLSQEQLIAVKKALKQFN